MTAVAAPPAAAPPAATAGWTTKVLPAATVALCSALLFLVEPMAAKLLLPLYGGSAAVWTGSVLFFQVVLLAGYGCVHTVLRQRAGQSIGRSRLRLGLTALVLLLGVAVLPLHVPRWAEPGSRAPLPWLLLVLAVMVGLPFLALSVAGPLVSSWLTVRAHGSPYRLYAASNAGGLIGLLAYPLAGEPLFGLDVMRRLWSAGYLVAVVLILVSAVVTRRGWAAPNTAAPESAVPLPGPAAAPERRTARRERLTWLALAALPVSLMLGTTTVLTTDVAPVPLLWVVPLGLYLLTLAIAFAPAREGARPPTGLDRRPSPTLVALLAVAAVGLAHGLPLPNLAQVLADLVVLTVTSLIAHRRLAASRPPLPRLTEFYLLVAIGGALGGAWNSLAAPVLFVRPAEYPLALLAAVAMLILGGGARLGGRTPDASAVGSAILDAAAFGLPLVFLLGVRAAHPGEGWGLLLAAVLLVGCYSLARRRPLPLAFGLTGLLLLTTVPLPPPVAAGRNFYGSYVVNVSGGRRLLTEGTTVHGWQYLDRGRRDVPTAYYGTGGPIGQVFETYRTDPALGHVAVVGLGIGTLAAYGQPGQSMTFYELDPQIPAVARDPKLFSFLVDSRARTSVVVGDGRLNLARTPPGSVGLLVLDAFASDAIPTHLLTAEAFRTWEGILSPDGMIAVHITNRYLNLAPVLAGAARREGLTALVRKDPADNDPDRTASQWVVLARQPGRLDPLRRLPGWRPLPGTSRVTWTDDASSLLGLFRLHGSH